jgi:hypothetical protein
VQSLAAAEAAAAAAALRIAARSRMLQVPYGLRERAVPLRGWG